MSKKVVYYFVFVFVLSVTVTVYFLFKEKSKNEYIIDGEYDIWGTEEYSYDESSSEKISEASETDAEIETDANTKAERLVYLNINTASFEDFKLLKGIGEVIAGNIIDYRETIGGFNNIEEIMNVKGIGEKTFQAIKGNIYVENPVYPAVTAETMPESLQTYVTEEPDIETSDAAVRYNLNIVSMEELETVPGIDHEMAESIINLRTSIQYFSNVYELIYADGMSDELFIAIEKYFYI